MKITTLRTMAGTSVCGDYDECPSLHRTNEHPDRVFVIAKRVEDPALLDAFASRVGPDEVLGFVPNELLPEV